MRFYTPERVGQKQSLTPEGFLLCQDVPIARTGSMVYGPNEVPVEPGPDGLVVITREEDQVFRPETVASFMGKPVVDEHPEGGDVNPSNWRSLAVGTVQNVRRGVGVEDDLLLADLLITDASAIDAVREGKREVSCGYDADYDQITPGRGRQLNIIGNHVALVERGRCGPRCAIGDQETMPKRTVWDRIMTAFKARDEEALKEAMEEAKSKDDAEAGGEEEGGNATHLHVHLPGNGEGKTDDDDEPASSGEEAPAWFAKYAQAAEARFKGIEEAISKLAGAEEAETEEEGEGEDDAEEMENGEEEDPDKEATGDKRMKDRAKKKTKDSDGLEQTFQDTLARAEILVPGIRLPTFDAALTPERTEKRLCSFRRRALSQASESDIGKSFIQPLMGGKAMEFTGMTCDAVRIVFNGASELARQANNRRIAGNGKVKDNVGSSPSVSIADINKRNRERYGQPTR